jgi:predicted enzyme related to lactoylglutathione lyase
MPTERRQVLMLLAAAGAFTAANSARTAPGDTDAEKVLGIGGFFFRAADPAALGKWYRDHLGIALTPADDKAQPWRTEAGVTSFTPFPKDTKYFGGQAQGWMINFRVKDVQKFAAQLSSQGIAVKVDPKTYPYGRFAHLHDPEGNPIELWQPAS